MQVGMKTVGYIQMLRLEKQYEPYVYLKWRSIYETLYSWIQVRLSIKKILFPVQRVAKIEASRAAAIFLYSTSFFPPRKILSIFRKKYLICKNEKKKSPVAPFLATREVYRKQNYFY